MRYRCISILMCVMGVMLALYAPAHSSRLAYLRHRTLWVVSVGADGRPLTGGKPTRFAMSWALEPGDDVESCWSPDGKTLAIAHRRDASSGPDEWEYWAIWLLSPGPGRRPRRAVFGSDPSFSPDGKQIAFTSMPSGYSILDERSHAVFILDIATGKTRVLRAHTNTPFWSRDGNEIAAIDTSVNDDAVVILDAKTGRVKLAVRRGIPVDPMLSPTGRYLAYHLHLSNPVTGHSILDRRTGRELTDCCQRPFIPTGHSPGLLLQWSPNEKLLLWTFRVPVPNSDDDGDWLREEVWVTSLSGRGKHRIGSGGKFADAAFAPDGTHVLWLRPTRRHCRGNTIYDLVCRSISGGRIMTIARDVDEFVVSR